MKLASSRYYYKSKTDVEGQARSDAELRNHIARIQGEFSGYGYRHVDKQLRREGSTSTTNGFAVWSESTGYFRYAGRVLRSSRTPENRHPAIFTIPIAVCSTFVEIM